ncbi:MAG: hypothetical protein ACR2PM_18465, partial [Hyphomicrobiales bacterium]
MFGKTRLPHSDYLIAPRNTAGYESASDATEIEMRMARLFGIALCAIAWSALLLLDGWPVHADQMTRATQQAFAAPNKQFLFVTVPDGADVEPEGLNLSRADAREIEGLDKNT